MADITYTAASIRPLGGAVVRRGTAGGAGNVGEPVYLDGTNGWKQADADVAAQAQARGIVVAVNGNTAATAFVSGDELDIVRHGPVGGYSSLTPGGAVFVSPTAGKLDQTATVTSGDFVFAIGYADSATTIYVQPQITVPAAL